MNWGSRLKQILIEREMSQVELASKAGLSESYISRACRGDFKGVQQMNFERIARALSMTPGELSQKLKGDKRFNLYEETPEQIMERLRLVHPVTVPIYEDFPFHAGEPVEPMENVAVVKDRARGRNLEGYLTRGKCFEHQIGDGDIIIVDRDGQVDIGNIIACLYKGELWLGKLRQIADELWIENNVHRFKLEECSVVAPVVEVRRRLK